MSNCKCVLPSTRVCGIPEIRPVGALNAPILFVGDSPSWDSIKMGGAFEAFKEQDMLSQEFGRVGLLTSKMRLTYFWKHKKVGSAQSKDRKGHLDYNMQQIIEEMKSHPVVILSGGEAVKTFTDGMSVQQLMGLDIVQYSVYLPANVEVCMVFPSIEMVMAGELGEFRLAADRLAKELE